MKTAYHRVLTEYQDQRTKPFKPSENPLSKFMINDIPNMLKDQLYLDDQKYKVQASVGMGRWTETPWISIFDRDITKTATKGFYIVYLFRKDMKGVYLSLNQGTTHLQNKYKKNNPRSKMEEIALKLQDTLSLSLEDFPTTKIDLISKTSNSKNYMASHICGKYYSLEQLPTNQEIQNDFQKILKIYQQLKTIIGVRTTDQFIDYLLNLEEIEDTQYQSDVQLVTASTTEIEPQQIPPKENTGERLKWRRNASIAKETIHLADYLCEVNADHFTFKSSVTGKNFVEAHHLIPLSLQGRFRWSLDVPGNIISLCPNCHRSIHHADKSTKHSIIKKLYTLRQHALQSFEIDIPLNHLLEFYK
ncbi:MrcB family domain-containing protein [Alkalicoccobacillus gibsonii]|uniref:MrcB family domain-containing protein n=1 Tax=Alkalicoccobacillus gibsonii TaxID=79881 RepID=UPI003F7B661E